MATPTALPPPRGDHSDPSPNSDTAPPPSSNTDPHASGIFPDPSLNDDCPDQPFHARGCAITSGASAAALSPKSVRKRLAERMLEKSKLIDPKSHIYQLPLQEGKRVNTNSRIARCYVGEKPTSAHVEDKVLMVVGATGAGKSTLINGIVNYLLGVRWEDPFRFKMIVEHPGTQAKSVTSWITAYTIYRQAGSPFPYNFTIIDTPGFGDTDGLKRDKEITMQIKEFFSMLPVDGGIDHLDGIGFVTQASLARLTHTQKYIFDSILSTFGKDIASNIFMMITFADGKKPPVVDAIKASDIPFCKYFKFNNSALFPIVADEEDEGGDFDEMFWSMGMKSFGNFFKSFESAEPRSLQLTREVLEERQRLEANVNGLQPRINEGLAKIEEMRKEQKIMESHEADIETNKEFKFKITVTKQRKVDLGRGRFVTNCLRCTHTCHNDCGIADDAYKYNCSSMDDGGQSSACCTVCPERCGWRDHVNNPYYFELYNEEEERTSEDLKKKYDAAMQGKATVADLIHETERRLSQMDELVMDMIQQVQHGLKRLDEIALKPNPLSEVEYIELMIVSEKNDHKAGWDERVQYLEGAKQQAQITTGIARSEISPQQQAANRESLWTKIKGWWNKDSSKDTELVIKSEKSDHKAEGAKQQAQITSGITHSEISSQRQAANRETTWSKMRSWWMVDNSSKDKKKPSKDKKTSSKD